MVYFDWNSPFLHETILLWCDALHELAPIHGARRRLLGSAPDGEWDGRDGTHLLRRAPDSFSLPLALSGSARKSTEVPETTK